MLKPENPGDEKMIQELKEAVPIELLTFSQFAEAKSMTNKLETIKYIHSIINDGLKTARIYYDLYIEV